MIIDPTAPSGGQIDALYEDELSIEQVLQTNGHIPAANGHATEMTEYGAEKALIEEMAAGVAEVAAPFAPIQPAPIMPTATGAPYFHRVSGQYRSDWPVWELVLRVDVDGRRPTKRISGDFFHTSGFTKSHFGSFVVDDLDISVSSSAVTLSGVGKFTYGTSYEKITVEIPRVPRWYRRADATVKFFSLSGTAGATFECGWESSFFRTVEIEEDAERNVTPFTSYNTGQLPSGGPARNLTIARAYKEAGIDMRAAGVPNVLRTAPGGSWSNAELHAAMERNFSLWRDQPQWKVWLLHAMRHEFGPGLLGIMFDDMGRQRQGCAVFYGGSLGANTPQAQRSQLYTCVHELGHCFNLFHSFHKTFMNPPMPNRLSALSWMNYPQNFPGGSNAFWSQFAFQFDHLELIHLRHAFRNNIVMGGNPFGVGAALIDSEFADPVEDHSGIRLELEMPKALAFGEPPVVEVKLYASDLSGKAVHKHLHPNFSFVKLAIQKPGGATFVYEPPIEHCVEIETVDLSAETPSIYESAYIGYDKNHGVIFDTPGTYTLRGIYYALDGSVIISNVLKLRVRPPISEADEAVAELLLGDEQGMLFYLLGSDAEILQSGNDAFDEVINDYGDHHLAVYPKLAKGVNAARTFKTLTSDYGVEQRKPESEQSIQMLEEVTEASLAGKGVDNITLNMAMQKMALAQSEAGDKTAARETAKRLLKVFKAKNLKPHVEELIKDQVTALRREF